MAVDRALAAQSGGRSPQHIERAVESFKKTWGSAPRGWYCRYGPSVNTRELVVSSGHFLYDSDAYNDDLPYFKPEVNWP